MKNKGVTSDNAQLLAKKFGQSKMPGTDCQGVEAAFTETACF